ncbi:P-loop containing nucleoside triphosphate hydrolase protein [Mycena belliarum]|uniref:DNA 3'-5' helicase n=1 Tax=Mycena belliarum TaxID=1033014 RepID=A0AAD6UHW8_9AGAR|nr:P-loop containing nucleoside triphosphate hydrolase protein [Mycena belliae]
MAQEDETIKRAALSQHLLQEARDKARVKSNYDSAVTRRDLTRLFEESFKKPAYGWQLDVSEAFILGMDILVIAGTGAGKTIPFMMPLLLMREKFSLIISPLKVLQEDQAKRFKKVGLKAAAVNGDTYTRNLQKDLDSQTHNAIFTSPEMCFKHDPFRKWLRNPATAQRALGAIIDEAHCISQWGGDFRPHYAELYRLRGALPVGTPILATSATLSPAAIKDVCSTLHIDLDEAFVLNLGNDRPNITPSIIEMKSAKDYGALKQIFGPPSEVHGIADVPKSIVFANAVKKTQIIKRMIYREYPNLPPGSVDFLHAHRTAKAKRRVMKDFRRGKIKILVATEAAGMGADISDIELIVQFGVPSSLAVWTQRAGRAGRSFHLHARAVMIVERTMFQRKKKRRRKGNSEGQVAEDPDSSDSDSNQGSEDESANTTPYSDDRVNIPNDGKVWVKNVDPVMREYISTRLCRRDMADRYYNNPPRRPPTGDCCDNCVRITTQVPDTGSTTPASRPATPEGPSPPSSPHSTPSKSVNANGKRPMQRSTDGPKTRRKEHLKMVREALERWRLKTYLDKYSKSCLPEVGIMPDQVLTSLASNRVNTVEEMKALTPSWMLARRHGEEVLNVLHRIDRHVREQKEQEKEAKAAQRRLDTVKRKAARDLAAAAATPKPRGRPPRSMHRPPLAAASTNTIPPSTPAPVRPYARSAVSPAQNPTTVPHHSSPMPPTSPTTSSPYSWVPYMPVQPLQSHSTPVNHLQNVSHTPSTSRTPYAPPPQYASPPPQFHYSHLRERTPMHEGPDSPAFRPQNGGHPFMPLSTAYPALHAPAFNTALNVMPLYMHPAHYDSPRNPVSRLSYEYGTVAPHPPHTPIRQSYAHLPSMFAESPLWHNNSITDPEDGHAHTQH